MIILLLGATGMLGSDIQEVFASNSDITLLPFSSKTCDISNQDQVTTTIQNNPCDLVINCAAYTKVDQCETEKDLAFSVNATGPKWIAQACAKTNTPLIHFSTDYVFNGTKPTPYTEDDPTDPINTYGASKLAGETEIINNHPNHYILRVQWLYGEHGPNFIKTILNAAKTRDELSIVNDQWGAPTWTKTIATTLLTLIQNLPEPGIYNLAPLGETTWYDYATYFLNLTNYKGTITPVPSTHYPTPAKRPHNSKLNTTKLTQTTSIKLEEWNKDVKIFTNILTNKDHQGEINHV